MQTYSTATVNCPARKLFAPLFRARRQNMQNIVTDSVYLSQIPPAYKTYYQTYIQQWLDWSRGFVPQLHARDFFSTGIGYSVCDILTRMCMSGGYRIQSKNADTQDFFQHWCEDDLNNVLNKMFFLANAGGNSFLCLTPVNGELYPTVIPVNRIVFQIGRTGRISDAVVLNRFISGENAYYVREQRHERDGKAYWCVKLACSTPVTSPAWGQNWLREVPKDIKSQWEYCYGDIKPCKWYTMPKGMRGIGVYNVRNKAVAAALMDMPGYSDSTLHTCLDILYAIDYNYTMGQVDQYMGKSRALVPKQMAGRRIQGTPGTMTDGMSFEQAINDIENQPLEDEFYTQVGDQTVDGKPIQPLFIQPDLRGDKRSYIQDAYIQLLSGKIGVSASTLSSNLAGGGTKTDDQISAETSIDEKTVGNKRMLANRAIKAMLSDVANFYGLCDDVTVEWGRSTANSARENEELLQDYRAGTLPIRDYLRKRWIDLDETEIEKMAAEVEKKQREENQFAMPGMEGLMNENENEYGESDAEPADHGT